MPNRPAAALIGRVGEISPDAFYIGADRGPVRMRSSGRLLLGVNDDYLQDTRDRFAWSFTTRGLSRRLSFIV